jgi:hypothetical protein
MKNIILTAAFVAAAAVSTFACSSKSSSNANGATDLEVSQCHSGCDQAKFFNCSDANSLSICYDDCGTAAPSAIDKFNACSQDSICDPTCRGLIDPPAKSSSSGGGGVGASDCNTACNKLITQCNFAPVGELNDCISQCQSQGYQYQIDCVNNNQCSDIQARCGSSTSGGGGTIDSGISTDPGVFECQGNCSSLHSQTCLTATELSTCNSDCSSITGAARSSFNTCVETANGADCTAGYDCYTTFAAN